MPESTTSPIEGDLILYATSDGAVRLEVVYQDETFWLSQKRMAELFGVDVRTISEHLRNIFATGELAEDPVIRKFRTTAADGKTYETQFYHLDAIIAVGYRVNSRQATQFRIWATQTLREYIIKGFVLDDERLKQGKPFGKDYFDELLERIREIRASERRFYLKITDIYEQCSIDYQKDAEVTQSFFKTVQNKLHWAITGQTAAELIAERASADRPNMGLTTWKKGPAGKIQKSDVTIAKNYLIEKEIKELERIVSMYLDYAENQAARQIPMKMDDWVRRLDDFLRFNEYEILTNASPVPHGPAEGCDPVRRHGGLVFALPQGMGGRGIHRRHRGHRRAEADAGSVGGALRSAGGRGRARAGTRQPTLAGLSGGSGGPAISRLESGNAKPSITLRERVAKPSITLLERVAKALDATVVVRIEPRAAGNVAAAGGEAFVEGRFRCGLRAKCHVGKFCCPHT